LCVQDKVWYVPVAVASPNRVPVAFFSALVSATDWLIQWHELVAPCGGAVDDQALAVAVKLHLVQADLLTAGTEVGADAVVEEVALVQVRKI
jgi:hypothetical protein